MKITVTLLFFIAITLTGFGQENNTAQPALSSKKSSSIKNEDAKKQVVNEPKEGLSSKSKVNYNNVRNEEGLEGKAVKKEAKPRLKEEK